MFAFLSGYTYGMRPLAGDKKRFLLGKARRLLLPMLFVGAAFVFGKSIAPGTNAKVAWDWYHMFVLLGSYPYWFLGSLFTIFIAIVVLEMLGLLANRAGFSIVLVSAIAIQLTIPVPSTFGLRRNLSIPLFSLRSRLRSISDKDKSHYFSHYRCLSVQCAMRWRCTRLSSHLCTNFNCCYVDRGKRPVFVATITVAQQIFRVHRQSSMQYSYFLCFS